MIELKHLRTLQALRNSGSLAGAAAQLHQTQSALSHQFSDLEQRLGFAVRAQEPAPALHRPGRDPAAAGGAGAAADPAGAAGLPRAASDHAAHRHRMPQLHSVADAGAGQLPPAFPAGGDGLHFRRDFRSATGLATGRTGSGDDVGYSARSGLHYSPMFDFEVRLVLAPDHPLAGRPHIEPEDLSDETLLIYPVQRQRLDIWRHFLQPAGVSPALKNVDNTLLLIQMVSARMGLRRCRTGWWRVSNSRVWW